MSVPTGTLTVRGVYEALDRVKDPCMVAAGHDLSILDLGLVYDVEVQEDGSVRIDMTLTELGCIFSRIGSSAMFTRRSRRCLELFRTLKRSALSS